MNNLTHSVAETNFSRAVQSDEIDLLELLRSVGRTWKHVFLGFVLVSMAYAGWLSLRILGDNSNPHAHNAIKLTFAGADKGTYPNGAPFQLEDIIAPVIVQQVFEQHNLPVFDVSVEEFSRSLSIKPYAPTFDLIVARYRELLSNTSLTAPEVSAIEERMSTKLAVATSEAAILTMSFDRFELPSELASRILSGLPATWAQHSIANNGVLDMDIQLASAQSIDRELINNVDYMVISDLLKEKTGLIETNIELLSGFDGAATLKDPDTGIRLADLKQALEDLRRYVIDDLMSPIRSLGLTRNRDLSLYYYEDKRQRLNEDIQLLLRQADLVKEAFDKYTLSALSTAGVPAKDSSYAGRTPLSAGALDKVLAMSSESKAEEYRQTLNQQWLDINIQATGLQNQIDEVNRLIKALKGEEQSETSQALRGEYLARAEHTLPKILDEISNYLDITQRIYRHLSKDSVGVNGRLYEPITNQPFTKESLIDIKGTLLTWVALLFITIITVAPGVMIYQAFRGRQTV